MNNFIGIGRLTRDPELRYIPSGTAICKFTIAIDKGLSKDKKEEFEKQNKPTADFLNVNVWGKVGENSANYLAKGRLVAVQGTIESGSYEKDGNRIYTTELNAYKVKFLEWGEKKETKEFSQEGFTPTNNDDIPF